jgi:transposase
MAWRRGQALDQDLRDRVLACPDATLAAVAERFGVSKSYVSKARARLRNLGQSTPGPQHNHVPLRLEPFRDALKVQVTAVPDAKLRDLRDWLQTTHNVRVSHAVMWKVVARLGLTHKKSISGPPNRTART